MICMKTIQNTLLVIVFYNIVIYSAENSFPAHIVKTFNAPTQTSLGAIAFFGNSVLSIGCNDIQKKVFLYQVFLDKNEHKELFSETKNRDDYFITTNTNQNIAVIPLTDKALLLRTNQTLITIPIITNWPVKFLDDDTIIWVDHKLCKTYSIKNQSNEEFLYNTAIQNLNNRDNLRSFKKEIDKNPSNDKYALALEIDIATFDANKDINSGNPKIIPLTTIITDKNGDPEKVHLNAWDIQYSHDGSYITFTWDLPYNAWIVNPSTQKYFVLEDISRRDYSIDTKAFHPHLPIIATLRKCDGEIKFWYVPNGKCLITHILPEKTECGPASCLTHFISFSHDAELLAIEINRKVIIMKVPESLSELCELYNK